MECLRSIIILITQLFTVKILYTRKEPVHKEGKIPVMSQSVKK